ncbi:MAG: ABC transporter permease subunit [Bacteroidaceae bacterium]|nr:ABC transporter permease subunit [Bacteroidaceae bacterium]
MAEGFKKHLLCVLLVILAFTGCSKKEQPADAAFKPHTIGILTGTTFKTALEKIYPDAEVLYFENFSLTCMALKKGQIDAFTCPRHGSWELLRSNPGMRLLDSPVIIDTISIAFRPQEQQLADQFNHFLDSMRLSGELDRMWDKWLNSESLPEPYESEHINGKPITVGFETGQSFLTLLIDNEVAGFEPELMLKFGESVGRPVKPVEMKETGMIPALLSGRLDAIASSITPTPERTANMLFSKPYARTEIALCVYDPVADTGTGISFGGTLKQNIFEAKRYMLIIEGLENTLIITFLALVFGYLLGVLLSIAKYHGKKTRLIAEFYCNFIESIPIVVLLLFMFYVVFATSHISAMTVAVITFSLYFSVGASDCIERSIEIVEKGQWEAGYALGFKPLQILVYIIVPQAAEEFFAQFRNKAVGLIENTSIVGFIAIKDMTMVTDLIRNQTYNSLIPLAVVAILYFLIAFGITRSFAILSDIFYYKKRNKLAHK